MLSLGFYPFPAMSCLQAYLLIRSHSVNVLAHNINVFKNRMVLSSFACLFMAFSLWACLYMHVGGGGGGILSSGGGVGTEWKEKESLYSALASKIGFVPKDTVLQAMLCWETWFTFSFYLLWGKRYQEPGPQQQKVLDYRGPSGIYSGEEKAGPCTPADVGRRKGTGKGRGEGRC